MDRLIPVGRLFFAAGLAGFGVLQFVYGDFVAGRAPAWPADVPGRLVGAYLTGAGLIAAAAVLVSGKQARWAAAAVAVVVLLWATLRHIPLVAAGPVLGSDWTRAGKSLV